MESPSLRFDEDAGLGGGAAVAVDDADLVVDEFHLLELRVEADERAAQRGVERVHGAVALGHGVDFLAVDRELDRGLAGVEVVRAVLADGDVVLDQLEEGLVLAERLADEELERGVGGLEFVALVFERA